MPANRRWDARRDAAEPDVVTALEAAGYEVWRDLPTDLLLRHKTWPENWFRCIEVKTPTSTGKIRKRNDQDKQAAFCAATGTPRVTTPEDALKAVWVIW